jgi:hypothetical protein
MKALSPPLFAIVLLTSAAYFITGMAHAQSVPYIHNGTDLISCEPAPCVLPPTQASEGGSEVADAPIAADPLNPLHLLLGSVDDNCPQPSASGFHISSDGGSTWSRTCMPTINASGRVYWPGGEPMVDYDLNGAGYIADGYGDSEGLGYGLIGLQKSTDGVNWSTPVIALGSPNIFKQPDWASFAIDRSPQSPFANNLYISAVVLNEPLQNENQLVVSHSRDGGTNWKSVAVAPVQVSPAEDNFTVIAIGEDGTAYLTWLYCPGSGLDAHCNNSKAYMVFSKSVDGGDTWSTPSLMTIVMMPPDWTLPNSSVSVYNYPAIGVDNGNGPHAGNLYAVMYNWTGTYLRVEVIHSTDGGSTWSKPVPVAPASANHDQFFPWLSVSPTGLVGVSWLDRRNDPANVDYQAFAAISRDGGQTFQPNVQLTTAFSNPNINNETSMGDYTGNTWNGPNFVAAWMDSSNGVDMQDVVGGIRLH